MIEGFCYLGISAGMIGCVDLDPYCVGSSAAEEGLVIVGSGCYLGISRGIC
jgi:hypothetical protein